MSRPHTYQRWLAWEDKLLAARYAELGPSGLAPLLPRHSVQAIKHYAKKRGLVVVLPGSRSGARRWMAKLTDTNVAFLRSNAAELRRTKTITQLAADYGVCTATISRALTGKTFADVRPANEH